MNPEEGDLRPQFIDRFGLAVEIDHIRDAERRPMLFAVALLMRAIQQRFSRAGQIRSLLSASGSRKPCLCCHPLR